MYCMFAKSDGHMIYSWSSQGKNVLICRYVKYYSEVKYPGHVEVLDGKEIAEIKCGINHCLALTEDGRLFAWGQNQYGQIGFDIEKPNIFEPIEIGKRMRIDGKIDHINCYNNTSFAIDGDKNVYIWGQDLKKSYWKVLNESIFPPKMIFQGALQVGIIMNSLYFICSNIIIERNEKNQENEIQFEKYDVIHIEENRINNELVLQTEEAIHVLSKENKIEKSKYSNMLQYYCNEVKATNNIWKIVNGQIIMKPRIETVVKKSIR